MNKGKKLILRNALAKVVQGHIRMIVDIWGKIEETSEVRRYIL